MVEWSSPEMARVAELIRERSGLTFPEIRVRDVEASIERAIKRHRLGGLPDLLRTLDADAPTRDALVAELTIGETYFKRDPAQFELLRRRILPELLASRPPSRPLRIWSAGCASGEEPYSIAMLLDELGASGRAQIIGTDISRPRLVDAQRAVYSKWSLRGSTPVMREKYFLERGRYYELIPRIREQVEFRYLNLAEDRFPSLAAGIWGMDLILCRNVLIYFDRATVDRVAGKLLASLSEDGWLVLGASDPAVAEHVACDVVLTDAGLVYRRAGAMGAGGEPVDLRTERSVSPAADSGMPRPPAKLPDQKTSSAPDLDAPAQPPREWTEDREWTEEPAPDSTAGGAVAMSGVSAANANIHGRAEPAGSTGDSADNLEAKLVAAYERRAFRSVTELAESEPAESLTQRGWVIWLRALANQGCLDEAGAVADRALAVQGPTAELLYLHAVLLLQAGRAAEAAATARRALYLDRTLIVAHLTLADALRRNGKPGAARRSLRNAAALLEMLDRETQVPASDGDTAGRLAELVRAKLRLLEEAA
jgi:chemotaxis protein methyltransferase CheR